MGQVAGSIYARVSFVVSSAIQGPFRFGVVWVRTEYSNGIRRIGCNRDL